MLTLVTADDIIRGGACADGVYACLRRLPHVAAVMSVDQLKQMLPEGDFEHVARAAELDGYGDGDGDGYGGDGDGDGYGYGYGDGDGYGSGYGSGDGYGSGYGSGDGYGSGYGDGDGDGYGE